MPARSKEKKVPVLPQPAWISSTIKSAPSEVQISLSLRSQAMEATFRPPSP